MLDDPLLVLDTEAGIMRGTLPDALAALCNGTLRGFEGLAAHQRVPWFLFLAQVAAMALAHAGNAAEAEDAVAWHALGEAGFWRQALAALTPDCADSAWSLIVENPAKPALLQPPVRTGFERYGSIGHTPDEIDLLVTAKVHDVKPARAGAAEPRHWLLFCAGQPANPPGIFGARKFRRRPHERRVREPGDGHAEPRP